MSAECSPACNQTPLVLPRPLWPVGAQSVDLSQHPTAFWHDAAAALAQEHGLTSYDASWAAAAQALRCPLVSADRQLLAADLAVTPSYAAARLA